MDATDRIESEAALAPRGSQSKLSGAIFFVLLAALLFRVVSGVMEKADAGRKAAAPGVDPPLVRWVAAEKARRDAASAGRPVLYDFGAAWCGPCHQLDKEGWGNAELAGYANGAFVPVRVTDRESEEGKNPPLVEELQHRYAVSAFPTLVVASADGKEIARMEGWAGRDGLKEFLERSKAKAGAAAPATPR